MGTLFPVQTNDGKWCSRSHRSSSSGSAGTHRPEGLPLAKVSKRKHGVGNRHTQHAFDVVYPLAVTLLLFG